MNKLLIVGCALSGLVIGCASMPDECSCASCVCADAPKAKRPPSPSLRTSTLPYKLGVARYTMSRTPFDRALDILQDIDCHYLGLMEGTISYDASDAEIAAYKAKCASKGVEVVSAGPLYYCTEEELKSLCEFAVRYGMKYISVVPYEWNPKLAGAKTNEERLKILPGREWRLESDKMMDVLEKYVKKYNLRAAVHNHGPDNAYLYPTAESALARIGNRDKRIGVCLDVGHERRAGLDPVAFIKNNPDRIVEVHLKNIKIDPAKNFAKEGPRGELDIPGILTALSEVGFDGYCLIEYEKDHGQNAMPLAESFGYYRGVMDAIRPRPRMQPIPAGANTLTAAEKAEGYQLLFDGKDLPKDLWVGAKEEWNYKTFPTRGWFVKDGCLTMRPKSGITPDRRWFPLPPEDQKLAGAGDLVTVRKYKDFVFKFDFRLTTAANSGVKYFYNEGEHRNSCEEYQILEEGHPDSDKGHDGNRRVASLYDIFPAHAEKVVKPTGQWNSGMIVAKGNHVEHWLNGQKVLEYERGSKAFREGVAASKYLAWQDAGKFWGEAKSGRLLLQDHSDSTVSFCNLKVKEL